LGRLYIHRASADLITLGQILVYIPLLALYPWPVQKVFLAPFVIAGLLFLPSCTSKENLTTNSVRKITVDELKKTLVPEFEKYNCVGPQMIRKKYEDLAITLSKAWSQRYFMLDLEEMNTDKININLSNAKNEVMFIEHSLVLQNNDCFTDEEIREANEELESLLKTLE
jgi:hypothetical protein